MGVRGAVSASVGLVVVLGASGALGQGRGIGPFAGTYALASATTVTVTSPISQTESRTTRERLSVEPVSGADMVFVVTNDLGDRCALNANRTGESTVQFPQGQPCAMTDNVRNMQLSLTLQTGSGSLQGDTLSLEFTWNVSATVMLMPVVGAAAQRSTGRRGAVAQAPAAQPAQVPQPAPQPARPAPGAPAIGGGYPSTPGYGAPGYGMPSYGAPSYGAPGMLGGPGYGGPAVGGVGAPAFGGPAIGAPGMLGGPGYGTPGYGAPAIGGGWPAYNGAWPGGGYHTPTVGGPAYGAPGYGAPGVITPGYGAPGVTPGYGMPGATPPGSGWAWNGAPTPSPARPAPAVQPQQPAPQPTAPAPAPNGPWTPPTTATPSGSAWTQPSGPPTTPSPGPMIPPGVNPPPWGQPSRPTITPPPGMGMPMLAPPARSRRR
ncbi:MAG: hypothetical protein HY909_14015 [Deltaproteobacteria bacterium]|nr:hypothetical protein [Deltaproteobacteria bacterium]